jgi:hypothetical protein
VQRLRYAAPPGAIDSAADPIHRANPPGQVRRTHWYLAAAGSPDPGLAPGLTLRRPTLWQTLVRPTPTDSAHQHQLGGHLQAFAGEGEVPTMRPACFGDLGARAVQRPQVVKQSINCIVRLFRANKVMTS